MKKNKSLDTLVDDIYSTISTLTKGKDIKLTDQDLKVFGEDMANALKQWATPRGADKVNVNTLRMSNIGKPSRQLWYDMNSKDVSARELESSTLIKLGIRLIPNKKKFLLVELKDTWTVRLMGKLLM
jgi:hypothetical protein